MSQRERSSDVARRGGSAPPNSLPRSILTKSISPNINSSSIQPRGHSGEDIEPGARGELIARCLRERRGSNLFVERGVPYAIHEWRAFAVKLLLSVILFCGGVASLVVVQIIKIDSPRDESHHKIRHR